MRRTGRTAPLAVAIALTLLALAAPLAGQAGVVSSQRATQSGGAALQRSIVDEINGVRRSHGLRPLRLAADLARAAGAHARSMGERGYFSHASADGTSPSRRIHRFYSGSAIGETLLWRSPDISADQAVQLWLSSPEHRTILLSPGFSQIGLSSVHVSHAPGAFGGLDVTIVVADFGSP